MSPLSLASLMAGRSSFRLSRTASGKSLFMKMLVPFRALVLLRTSNLSLWRRNFATIGLGLVDDEDSLPVLWVCSSSVVRWFLHQQLPHFVLRIRPFFTLWLFNSISNDIVSSGLTLYVIRFIIESKKTFADCFHIIFGLFAGITPCLAVGFEVMNSFWVNSRLALRSWTSLINSPTLLFEESTRISTQDLTFFSCCSKRDI